MKISRPTEADTSDGGQTSTVCTLVIEPTEARILVSLADQLQVLLADSLESPIDRDSAVRRLLPDAYRSDPELSTEWRKLSRRGLVDRKIGYAHTISTALAPTIGADAAGSVPLTMDAALDWVRSIGDLRLVIADRMGIVVDGDDGTFAEPGLRDVYELLAWMQDGLVQVLDTAQTPSTPDTP
ncbi:MAG: DUF2017 family protein [Microcella sp.]|nr:DUF2017 family protein [Microcella sp.]